jgi:hypothetical protein
VNGQSKEEKGLTSGRGFRYVAEVIAQESGGDGTNWPSDAPGNSVNS